ncbi:MULTISPECIES: hypothetical protein [Natrialbaceae]|nr:MULTISPECIES: hypothetical protein [Natrialbaceae]MDQ2052898.1 hypothetical protein [Natronolimnohabitans sp. A-GB9]
MSADLDQMIARVDEQIGANMAVLSVYNRSKADRDYRALTFEKATGEALL